MTITTTQRNATLTDMVEVLRTQQAQRFDVVAHSGNLRAENGDIVIADIENPVITLEGVTPSETRLTPTDVMDEGLAARLDIPRKYLRRMRETEGTIGLYDANVNEWLHRSAKPWFVRGFREEGAPTGVGRAFLSDRFQVLDNLDVLMAALEGIREAGVEVNIAGADLSERRMSVRVEAPAIAALAPDLLKNYRSPFSGATGADNPRVFAGFVISNSETGGGAFNIIPRLVVEICRNGMTMTKDAFRKVHLGSRMDEGIVRWTDDTQQKNVALIAAQARDAVTTFCDVDYVRAKLAEITEQAGVEVKPTEVVERVGKALAYTQAEQEGILGHFIKGGDITAGGVLHAVTSFAQTVADPDRANALEESGMAALAVAAR